MADANKLRPVRRDYEPAYPQQLTEDEVLRLLRPGLFERFSPATLLAGAVIAGALAGGCDNAPAGGGAGPGRGAGPGGGAGGVRSTRTDPALKAKADQVVSEVLGKTKKGFWNERSSINPKSELAANPPVKYPRIPISYGNSYVGIFDTEAAREATRRLFATYGLEVRPGVRVKGDGFEFVADGFDETTKTGFKLMTTEQRVRLADQKVVAAPPEQVLDEQELAALDKAVQAGQLKIFVANGKWFPNMDGDLYTPMQYYLASVVDYLNWVHGDRQIDPETVLGKLPGGAEGVRKQVIQQTAVPGERG